MLEVRNLKKIYKTKNGADVNALNGVSLQFPETGMVFLLGKSGSGKSTLLNVCGGLDAPTEGEIIVKGRSSQDFSQSDFDSYRNTFIGFIFQEYNILNEFTVEDNIALALELQGKPKDKAAIDALLREVDMEGFAKRKPNTLSGGQKQRIAIARALVKAPQIIMADEPTGALDSNTGKQVFETLKKLSKDKLVIVVSHDRDFAENYGDRIIELKDGEILSDVSKIQVAQQVLSEHVNTVGDVLCIKGGSDLTEGDFERIKAFLKASKEDVIIANNDRDVENFKKVSRINDRGEKEVFRDTDGDKLELKSYTKEDSRFIRSTLPLRHAVKIGASGLKSKPFRLVFTILLCVIAFTLFGLLSTLSLYDSEAAFKNTLKEANVSVIQLNKLYKGETVWYQNGQEDYRYELMQPARFSEQEIEKLGEQLGAKPFGAIEVFGGYNVRQAGGDYWVSDLIAVGVLPEDDPLREKINGTYPEKENEILISSYAEQLFYACKAYGKDESLIELSNSADIVGKEIQFGGKLFKVTGIFDSGEVPAEYDVLKDDKEHDPSLVMEYQAYLEDGLHRVAFVSPEGLKPLAEEFKPYIDSIYQYTSAQLAIETEGKYDYDSAYYISYMDVAQFEGKVYALGEKTVPGVGEVVMGINEFGSMVRDLYNQKLEKMNETENYDAANAYLKKAELADQVGTGVYWKDNGEGKREEVILTAAEREKKAKELIKAIKADQLPMQVEVKIYDQMNQAAVGEARRLNVIGFYQDDARMGMSPVILAGQDFNDLWTEQKLIVESYSDFESNYQDAPDAIYNRLYMPFVYSEQSAEAYWQMYHNEEFAENDSRIGLTGNFIGTLQTVDSAVKAMSQVFLYVGLVMAVFAALLFSNFISVSISQKKREIGILRAVGARSADVFKIFFSESFVIAAICIVLSTAASIIISNLLNRILASELGAALLVFGVVSFLILLGVALLTAVVATFLPVYNAAKKKPVDSIRAL